MLIIFEDAIINTANITKIRLAQTVVEFYVAKDNCAARPYEHAKLARKAFNRIIDALKVGERILDLRGAEQ